MCPKRIVSFGLQEDSSHVVDSDVWAVLFLVKIVLCVQIIYLWSNAEVNLSQSWMKEI